jgi:hypothetical protein
LPAAFSCGKLVGMASAGTKLDSLRLSRSEIERLVFVLLLSLALHLLSWGGYELGKKFGWWQELHWPAWLHHAKKIEPVAQTQLQNQEPPLEFVTVDQPSAEAPKNAKYFSSHNSIAANPDASRETDTPKLNGEQADAPKTEDAFKLKISQPQAAQQKANSQQDEGQDKPALSPGDLTLGKPTNPQPQPEQQRPRTLNEARAQLAKQIPGLQMLQDGGVQRHAVVPSLDVKLTGFGDYDERFYEAVVQRWWDLLDSQQFARDRSGKVILQFHLNYDGTISDMKVVQNDVGELLGYVCQKAVFDPAPFEHFPSDMRLKLGNYSTIQFAFYYY